MQRIEYPCPECGDDGPHDVVDEAFDGSQVCACAYCYVEFEIPRN
jgi:uncharacterized Zn finger protein